MFVILRYSDDTRVEEFHCVAFSRETALAYITKCEHGRPVEFYPGTAEDLECYNDGDSPKSVSFSGPQGTEGCWTVLEY